MPSRYLIDIIMRLAKEGTGGKDLTKELEGVNKAAEKSGSIFDTLGSSWQSIVGLGAGVAGAAIAIKKAFDLGKEGAVIAQTAQSFDLLMDKVGASADILDQLRDKSRNTVSDMELMASTSTLLAGAQGDLATNLAKSTPELLEIAKAANKLNPALGDTTFLYQSLATGVKRASPLILDNLGLTIKIGEANERLAQKLGKTVEELSAEEKQMALLEDTLRAGRVLIDQVGGDTEAMGDSFAQAEVKIKNATDQLKAGLAPAIADVLETVAETGPTVADTANQILTMVDAGLAWAGAAVTGKDATSAFNEVIKQSIGYYDDIFEGGKQWSDQMQASAEASRKAAVDVEDLDGSVLRYAHTTEGVIVVLDQEVDLLDAVAEAEKEAKQATQDLEKAQDALADAVGRVMERYEGFYSTLAEGIVSFRDLGAAQDQAAKDYESSLADLEAKQRGVTSGMKMNWEASLPDKTSVAERLGMAGDAWDEWGLRLQDIINQGVASPWFATLQQMGMEKPPDVGVKEWAADLQKAFYLGEVPDLLPPEWAQNVRDQQAEATAAFQVEAGKRRAAVQEEIDALNAAREAQLEAERAARNEATVELALSMAEQMGVLQAWSEQEFGPDFSVIADSASEVMGLLESGMLEVDGSLENLIQNMVAGIDTMIDTTGEAAAAWPAQMEKLAEFDPLTAIPVDEMVSEMGELGMSMQQALIPEELPEDPMGLNQMFVGMENIMGAAGDMESELTDAFQNVDAEAGSAADSVLNYWVGNSVLPEIATGAMNMSNLTVAAFQTMDAVGSAAGTSVGTSWATGLQAAQQELKKMVASLKSLPTDIEIHLTTVVTGGGGPPDLQHGGQWTVRGRGGIDNVPVFFNATPGEVVTVTPRGQTAPGFQQGGQFTVPNVARTVYVSGDRHTWNIRDQGSVSLAMRLVQSKRKERLNEFMGA